MTAADNARLAQLEEAYHHLGREVGGLRSDLQALAGEIRGELSRRSRVQWSPMIAAVAVVITIIGAFAQGPLAEIRRIDTRQSEMAASRFTESDGSRLETRINRIEGDLHDLQDEDFDRPEAERMEARIMEHYVRLADALDRVAERGCK